MIIAFETKRLRAICEDETVASKAFGPAAADALQQRLADLRAADTIHDLIVGNPVVSGPDQSTLTIALAGGVRTLWSPNHVNVPRRTDGQVDWDRTRRIRLLAIERS